ncbi:MAG: hypothetical protein WA173_01225 [Pseudomonas sp.]|uniref:hypothetical protein n=1 Tax=Pseudomonas sp. TaxID=306 RepID=UPI003BB813E1
MSEPADPPTKPSRAAFHQQHQLRAEAEALRLLAAKPQLGGRWLAWVAGELYALSPAPFAQMVRRELERLSQ